MPNALAVIHENIPTLEVADSVTLDHLLADVTVANAVVRRLSPTMVVVDPAKVEMVVTRLRKLGHLPKVR
jgi:hypothetical protein